MERFRLIAKEYPTIAIDDKIIGEIPLISKEEAKEIKKKGFFERIFAKEK